MKYNLYTKPKVIFISITFVLSVMSFGLFWYFRNLIENSEGFSGLNYLPQTLLVWWICAISIVITILFLIINYVMYKVKNK